MRKKKLNLRDEIDFANLLELMEPLHDISEYALLPELFSTVGYESLLKLCKYAGGETVKIPKLQDLVDSMYALQIFYDIEFKHKISYKDVPKSYVKLVNKIKDVYYVRNSN